MYPYCSKLYRKSISENRLLLSAIEQVIAKIKSGRAKKIGFILNQISVKHDFDLRYTINELFENIFLL